MRNADDHHHKCMSCGKSWRCPSPECRAKANAMPSIVLDGPDGPQIFDHICQRKPPATALRWSQQIPVTPGQYWYRSNAESRENFRRLHGADARAPLMVEVPVAVVLLLGPDEPEGELAVHFTVGTFYVRDLAGEWAGPIPLPSESQGDITNEQARSRHAGAARSAG